MMEWFQRFVLKKLYPHVQMKEISLGYHTWAAWICYSSVTCGSPGLTGSSTCPGLRKGRSPRELPVVTVPFPNTQKQTGAGRACPLISPPQGQKASLSQFILGSKTSPILSNSVLTQIVHGKECPSCQRKLWFSTQQPFCANAVVWC